MYIELLMQELPNHIKINILGYVQRRIHPCSILFNNSVREIEWMTHNGSEPAYYYELWEGFYKRFILQT